MKTKENNLTNKHLTAETEMSPSVQKVFKQAD